ncbi:MAG: hypothetical protein WCG01_05305 [bacterium]
MSGEFNAEVVQATVRGLTTRTNKSKKMLRGIYFNLEKKKTAENSTEVEKIQTEIEIKLKTVLKGATK